MSESGPDVQSIKQFLLAKGFPSSVDAGIILGSGLGGFENELENAISLSYSDIPGYPSTTVAGHSGTLNVGTVSGKTVIVYSGRHHYYEGHGYETTVLPVDLVHAFGAKMLVVSNATGSINLRFRVGDLMIIDDLLRIGLPASMKGPLSRTTYEPSKRVEHIEVIAQRLNIQMRKGCYLYVTGPTYETKAEIHAFRTLGADTVGMSTVPELMRCATLGLESIGISLITNMATGVLDQKLEHAEIKEVAELRKKDFIRLVKEVLKES